MPCVHAFSAARPAVRARRSVIAGAKEGIHPELYDAKIIVNGEQVGTITGTQKEYNVEVWSGNHPFYRGDNRALVVDEGQVNKFKSRYASLTSLSDVETLSGERDKTKKQTNDPFGSPAGRVCWSRVTRFLADGVRDVANRGALVH
eukprot:TRINITY_DN19356_c0_g1_i2.p1 TRINITY_DN19356_c0_g1~~TRINITY_DN19356_c0_g1_i2.p1  ORF type:complete len:165 (-),score=9.18 TRINITY_DN19356_c0_g1_i2:154-591(-)